MILGEWRGFHRFALEKQLLMEGVEPDAVESLMVVTVVQGPIEFSTDKGRYLVRWKLARNRYKEWELKQLKGPEK